MDKVHRLFVVQQDKQQKNKIVLAQMLPKAYENIGHIRAVMGEQPKVNLYKFQKLLCTSLILE